MSENPKTAIKVPVRFSQITATEDRMWALDSMGRIWKYLGSNDWELIESPQMERTMKKLERNEQDA